MGRLLSEVPGFDVVVETDAVGAAELGNDLHDFLLLLWREQVLAMMVTVVRAIATTEERANTWTSKTSRITSVSFPMSSNHKQKWASKSQNIVDINNFFAVFIFYKR